MTVERLDHVGVVVHELDAAIAFFVALGLTVQGRRTAEGAWVDRIIGLDGCSVETAMLATPDGRGKVELVEFATPPSPDGDPAAPPNAPGMRHLAFAVDDVHAALSRLEPHGAERVGEVVDYDGITRLCYVRGPAGIFVELAQPLGGSPAA